MSRRGVIAMTWLAVSGVPLALLAVVLVGCCALPFHAAVHRVLPLCDMAASALVPAQHAEHGGAGHPAAPAPSKQDAQDGPRLAWKREAPTPILSPSPSGVLGRLAMAVGSRDQVALGALRCDDDVGTRLALLDTLRL